MSHKINSFRRIDKTVSFNLLGETRKEERRRITREKIKLIRMGKSPQQVRNINLLKGTTPAQRKKRRNIIKNHPY